MGKATWLAASSWWARQEMGTPALPAQCCQMSTLATGLVDRIATALATTMAWATAWVIASATATVSSAMASATAKLASGSTTGSALDSVAGMLRCKPTR